MSAERAWYSYLDIQQRVREVLNVEVSQTTLRCAGTREGTARTRLTEGMPAPLPGDYKPARFDPDQIETWLANHLLLRQRQALLELSESDSDERQLLVAAARDLGVSWARIASAISSAQGRPYTTQAAHQRYGGTSG